MIGDILEDIMGEILSQCDETTYLRLASTCKKLKKARDVCICDPIADWYTVRNAPVYNKIRNIEITNCFPMYDEGEFHIFFYNQSLSPVCYVGNIKKVPIHWYRRTAVCRLDEIAYHNWPEDMETLHLTVTTQPLDSIQLSTDEFVDALKRGGNYIKNRCKNFKSITIDVDIV